MDTPIESSSVKNNYYQDENDAYTSTILEWFENDIDSIALNIPLPKTDGVVVKSSATNNLLLIQNYYRDAQMPHVKCI